MKHYYTGPISDHFDGERFFNPWQKRHHSFWSFLRWRLHAYPKPWPTHVNSLVDCPPACVKDSGLRVSFVGHATVFIQTHDMNILTDPIWSKRASIFKNIGPKRVTEPGIRFEDLPKIDLILISHNHYDHLDNPTLKKIWDRDQPVIIAPLGNDLIIQSAYPEIIVHTLDWHQSKRIGEISIYLEPAQHWSSRFITDRDKALWGSFVISTPSGKIYFAGDSGYGNGDHFRKILHKFGSFRFAMLPIGAYEPRWFMNYAHMNPEEAVRAHYDLGGPYTMGIHFGTFRLSNEEYGDPTRDLELVKQKHQMKNERFRALKIGEIWEVPLEDNSNSELLGK
ncbi:MAG: MBL fold metallo-hydrolase [Parachlamydiaceae bacterium]|nr:MBL fold metallo-hydrolase [Parachlamydiaceae bacterium]